MLREKNQPVSQQRARRLSCRPSHGRPVALHFSRLRAVSLEHVLVVLVLLDHVVLVQPRAGLDAGRLLHREVV